MNALLLIILLAHGGFWFGGTENTISVQWAAPDAPMPAAVLVWQLSYGNVEVSSGTEDIPAKAAGAAIKLKLPEARTITGYTWKYQLKSKTEEKLLESGTRSLYACPKNILADIAKRAARQSIVVLEAADDLTAALKAAGVAARRIESPADVQFQKVDIVMVGQDALPEALTSQRILLEKAREGARVIVFAQRKIKEALGIPLAARALKGTFTWNEKHPLFDRLNGDVLESWTRENPGSIAVLQLAKDAAIVDLARFSRETPGDTPAPVDAIAATQPIGEGRIAWCQIPVDSWQTDPRAAILLANTIDYLLTRPEPTPSQVQRAAAAAVTRPAPKPDAASRSALIDGDRP